MINEKIYKKFYNLKLTKEEEEYLEGQLKRYREEKAREEEIEKTEQEVKTSIKKLHGLIHKGDFEETLDVILDEYNYELYDRNYD